MSTVFTNEKDSFQALFQFASLGILVTDAESNILLANHLLLSQFGYEKSEELIGKKIEVLIPKRYDGTHTKHRNNYINNPDRRPMGVGKDLFGLKKNGAEFPVEVSLSHYRSKEKIFVIAFVIDITLRKEIENEILQQKEQLEIYNFKIEELNDALEEKVDLRTNQLQQAMLQIQASRDELAKALNKEKELGDLKSRFVSMASHEFRTPLSTILSSASLLAKYTQTSEQENRNKHILRIKSSVNNLTDILNEFLSIGKIEDGRIEVRNTHFNIKEFCISLSAEMQNNAKTGQKIIYKHKGEDWIFQDMSILRNIIFNLLSNAIKFSNDDGEIKFDTVADKKQFRLSIADNGIGISKEDQAHLFERFFRAGNATNIQGTGLGLHIVSKYVELLNGCMEFKSELEKGTSISIDFKTNTNTIL